MTPFGLSSWFSATGRKRSEETTEGTNDQDMTEKIILGVHSPRFASALASSLENAGIASELKPSGLASLPEGEPVWVLIDPADLEGALRVTEGGQFVPRYDLEMKLAGMGRTLLIPVDLSQSSLTACRIGFELASRLDLKPTVLHAYAVPYIQQTPPDQPFPSLDDGGNPLEEAEVSDDIRHVSESAFQTFLTRLDAAIKAGTVKDLHYEVSLQQGIPEEVILEFTRLTPPALVVMATRGKERRNREVIGSVTAEVLDTCRVPVFTVPDNTPITDIRSVKKLAFFCNLDGMDTASLEFLMKMFGNPVIDLTLLPVVRKGNAGKERMEDICSFLSANYPQSRFHVAEFPKNEDRGAFAQMVADNGIEMIVVPNKKTNVFVRLFKPGIPHRLLFGLDIPLLALPV